MTTHVELPTVKISLQEFHGTSPEECSEFLGTMRIEFLRNPSAYPTDGEKVGLAMSLFRGDALQWLNTKTDENLQTFMGSLQVFLTNVRAQFGLGDDLLKLTSRVSFDNLPFSKSDPVAFFAQARTHLAMMGIHSDVSLVAAIWHKLPQQVKDMLVARDLPNPSWASLRDVSVAVCASNQTTKKGKKPKCAHCGKKHSGECRAKN